MRAVTSALAAVLAGLTALPAGAIAADYLRGTQIDQPVSAPVFAPGFDWSGFYLGGGAGVSETKFKPGEGVQKLANHAFRNTLIGTEYNPGGWVSNLPDKRDSGSQFFGILGYNYLFGDVVLGFEADYTRSGHAYSVSDDIARRVTTSNGSVNDVFLRTNQSAKLNDYATMRLRMGWAYGRIMPFATFGGAVGRFDTRSTVDANALIVANAGLPTEQRFQTAGYPLQVGATRKNKYAFGLSAGAGVDWAVTDNLFLRAEYQIVRFAEVEGTTTTVNTGRVAAALKF